MSGTISYISCNLKNARSLIAENQRFQIKNSNKYIANHLKIKKPKLEFNNKLFIKSLLSNLENKKIGFFLSQENLNKKVKLNTILINKENNDKNKRYINNNFPKLRKSQSYVNIYEEKNSLIDNNIKSNKKFVGSFFDEMFKNQDIIITPKIRKINSNNDMINQNKTVDQNRDNFNLSFLVIKKAPTYFNKPRKIMVNSGTFMDTNNKVNRSIQSSLDIGFRNNKLKNIIYRNKSLKSNKSETNIHFKKAEYLKFLEKKSLALRANIIVNNIQESRGGKQELRSSYNPLNK